MIIKIKKFIKIYTKKMRNKRKQLIQLKSEKLCRFYMYIL